MSATPTRRLAELGIVLPEPARPVANYVPYKEWTLADHSMAGTAETVPFSKLVYTSGFIPVTADGLIYTGKLGGEVSLEQGQQCARLCTVNALAWLNRHLSGSLELIAGVLQVRGFVACTPDFYDHPKVLNACSDLLVDIFGEAGKHTRAAVGCPSLPLNAPVEIDFVFQLR